MRGRARLSVPGWGALALAWVGVACEREGRREIQVIAMAPEVVLVAPETVPIASGEELLGLLDQEPPETCTFGSWDSPLVPILAASKEPLAVAAEEAMRDWIAQSGVGIPYEPWPDEKLKRMVGEVNAIFGKRTHFGGTRKASAIGPVLERPGLVVALIVGEWNASLYFWKKVEGDWQCVHTKVVLRRW